MAEETNELTYGQKRVRFNYNPTNDALLSQIKTKAAEIVDILETIRNNNPERNISISTSQISLEVGVMWAEKAVTE